MNISTPIGTEILSVNFGFYSDHDVENISVKQIVNPTAFDNLGHPTKGGLYDEALGPFMGKSRYSSSHLKRILTNVVVRLVILTNDSVLVISDISYYLNLCTIRYYSNPCWCY